MHERLLEHEKLLQRKTRTFQGKEQPPKPMSFDLKKNKYLMFSSSEQQGLFSSSELPLSETLSSVRQFVSQSVCILFENIFIFLSRIHASAKACQQELHQ